MAEEEDIPGQGGGHSWRRGWHPGWEPHVLGQPKSVVLFREGQGGQCTAGGPQGRGGNASFFPSRFFAN